MAELLPCPFFGGKAFISAKMPYFGETITLAVVCETCNASSKHKAKEEDAIKLWNTRKPSLGEVAPQAEIARKICCEIEKEIVAALENNYKVKSERLKNPNVAMSDEFISYCEGKIATLRGIEGFIEELKKKYTEKEKT